VLFWVFDTKKNVELARESVRTIASKIAIIVVIPNKKRIKRKIERKN